MSTSNIHSELARIRRNLKLLRNRRDRARHGRDARALTYVQIATAEVIFHHERGGQPALRIYIERSLRKSPGANVRARVESEVELTMRSSSESWHSRPLKEFQKRCVRAAEAFLSEVQVFEWIRDANENRGSAPSSRLVDAVLGRFGVPLGTPAGRRQWLQRFRRRWHIRHGRLKLRPPVSLTFVRHGAQVFYRWLEFVESRVPCNRRLVRINFDETNIPFAFPRLSGYVTPRRGEEPVSPNVRTERLASSADRGSYTYLGFISDCDDIQRRLPRILIGKKSRLTKRMMQELTDEHLAGLEVWARDSAWVNQNVMLDILRKLAACWQDIHREIYPILILDHAPQHISAEIVNFAHDLGIELVFVPKNLTFLLQPLDVMVFHHLKRDLREAWVHARTEHPGGHVDAATHLRIVAQSTRRLFTSLGWARAFDATGITSGRRELNHSLVRLFGEDMRDVRSDAPTPNMLAYISSVQHPLPYENLIRRSPVLTAPLPREAGGLQPARRFPRARRLHGFVPTGRTSTLPGSCQTADGTRSAAPIASSASACSFE